MSGVEYGFLANILFAAGMAMVLIAIIYEELAYSRVKKRIANIGTDKTEQEKSIIKNMFLNLSRNPIYYNIGVAIEGDDNITCLDVTAEEINEHQITPLSFDCLHRYFVIIDDKKVAIIMEIHEFEEDSYFIDFNSNSKYYDHESDFYEIIETINKIRES